jgi:hypothetical protein
MSGKLRNKGISGYLGCRYCSVVTGRVPISILEAIIEPSSQPGNIAQPFT